MFLSNYMAIKLNERLLASFKVKQNKIKTNNQSKKPTKKNPQKKLYSQPHDKKYAR